MWPRQILFCLILFFLSVVSFAQELTVSPSSWDFGKIKDDKIQNCVFTIVNNSKQKIKVKTLPPSCGCIATVAQPNIISPGQNTKLHVSFQPKGRSGIFRWEVALETNHPQQPKIVIPLQAHVLRNSVLSEDLINFKIFRRGEQMKKTVWLACHRQKDFKLLDVKTTAKGFQCVVQETVVNDFYPGDQRGYRIDILAKKDIPYGRNHGEIKLKTNIIGKEQMTLRLFAYVIGDITVAPDYLAFGLVTPGKEYKRRVMLSHNKYQKFRILKALSDSSAIKVKWEAVIPEKYYHALITLKFPENTPPGEFRQNVRITTDCATQKEVFIKVQGIIPVSKK